MGHLLGQVTRTKYDEVGAMVSAIVIYLNENDAGPGFYRLASTIGLLGAAPSKEQRLHFWLRQVELVHSHYRDGHGNPVHPHRDAIIATGMSEQSVVPVESKAIAHVAVAAAAGRLLKFSGARPGAGP